MVTLGCDAHKQTHTVVVVDELGRELGHKTFKATSAGHLEALSWAKAWSPRRWAIEDCRHVSRRLEADLLGAGEAVLRVPPKLMASARRVARTPGKSDPIDALAVARAALREGNLPVARLEGEDREVRLLTDHREDLIRDRSGAQNRLRWRLHELEPELEIKARSLDRYPVLDRVEAHLRQHQGLIARLALDLVTRIRELTKTINQLEKELAKLMLVRSPNLLELHGCAALTAAKILGETAGITRFRSRAAFAMFNGSAPIPVWSGHPDRHRLNPGGNRQINAALHRIAITQLQRPGPGQTYFLKQLAAGHTRKEALRALKRRISDEVYRRLLLDAQPLTSAPSNCPMAA